MSEQTVSQAQRFGGHWTREKLGVLRAYLETYTTLMKDQGFTLHYVDAFAGSGSVEIAADDDSREVLVGSVEIALGVGDRPFDRLLFIDNDQQNVDALLSLISGRGDHARATATHGDANEVLPEFLEGLGRYERAVVFLDPFGAHVDWPTMQSVARSEKCDTWVLFASGYIRRFLIPRRGEIRSAADRAKLIRVYGDDPSSEIQHPVRQQSLFDVPGAETDRGTEAIVSAYQKRLSQEFAQVAPHSRTLKNSQNTAIYELMFAAANPKGASLAVKIADHILTRL